MEDFRISHSLPGIRSRADTVSSTKTNSPPDRTHTRSRTDPEASPKQQQDQRQEEDNPISHLHKRFHGGSSKHRHRHSSSPKELSSHSSRRNKKHSSTTATKDSSHSSSNSRSYGRQAKDTVASAIELKPPLSFDKLLGRGGSKAEEARKQQEESAEQAAEREAQEERRRQQEQRAREARARVSLKRVGEENAQREELLRGHLLGLEERGMRATIELDETLYAVLEKAAVLRGTVGQLQQLCVESKVGRKGFETEGAELEQNMRGILEGFGGFEKQEAEVGRLVGRLGQAREKTAELNKRLEAARERVEEYEARDREAERKRKWWWGVAWAVLGFVVSVMVAVFLARNHAAARMGMVQVREAVGERGGPKLGGVKPVVEEVLGTAARLGNASGVNISIGGEEADGELREVFEKL